MRVLVKLLLFAGMFSLVGGRGNTTQISLQSLINAAPEGGTVRLEAGTYREDIVINKPVVIEGEKGAVIKTCSSKPTVTITGKNVTLKDLKIESCQRDKGKVVVKISGMNHRLENLQIQTSHQGIQLENVEKSNFLYINLSGNGKKNGFDLWESHHNRFEGIKINHFEDGFYMENSHYNTFIGNTIQNSRYGMHVMFSDNITLIRNVSKSNFSGAMIMGTHQSIIKENQLIENNQNVNAQGLLLYDVHQSTIEDNDISHNRVGLFMENSSENTMENNEFIANFVGAQINKINSNVIEHNLFVSNLNDIQATKAPDNTIQNNYWDAAWKLDTDGDGKSNLSHSADPYFLNLAKETPPYQLFFQHPGLVLLQKMLKSPDSILVKDQAPLMNMEGRQTTRTEPHTVLLWILSLFMISSSLFIIYLGRKKA
ncbi:nitrous oxidase accessory protein [Bacillus sp. SLBN-46]|uniref:right-handed parallel beta-helix repeat-containing protein n=1 Tax=Bacillus sp. SLBN-46 TaxID=3042283 RepID=UPI0028672E2D|nr:NosD domain-containing protein [Bacillus sp. SLBN-46]MDR6121624.1 nitrous oxidase accessory protein [Bacillus sp. SLBN-46]